MTQLSVLGVCIAIYVVLIFAEPLVRRQWRGFVFQVIILTVVAIVGVFVNRSSAERVSFGSETSLAPVLVPILLATIFGIAARYIHSLKKEPFSWLDLLKSIVISPIILYPIWNSVHEMGDLNAAQTVSFCFLAFQNGFFWPTILAGAQPAGRNSPSASDGNVVD